MQFIVPLSPYSRPVNSPALAVASAIRREGDSIITVSIEPKDSPVISDSLQYGADEAYRIADKDMAGWNDSRTLSRILESFVKYLGSEDYMIFTEVSDSPFASDILPARLASLLGSEQFYCVTNVSRSDEGVFVCQDYGDSQRVCKVPPRSVIHVSGFDVENEIKESKGTIRELNRVDLGLGFYSVGYAGAKMRYKLVGGD